VVRTQVALDYGPKSLTFGCGFCNFQHAFSHLVEGPRYGFDEEVVLTFKMPVEASFSQAYALHHCPDTAAIAAVLAERTSCH
jgi:hypothetical protein